MRLLAVCVIAAGCSHQVTSPRPEVVAIDPRVACGEQLARRITVNGANFTPLPVTTLTGVRLDLPRISLSPVAALDGTTLGGAPIFADDASIQWASAESMSFEVGPELQLQPAVYDVIVTNPDGRGGALAAALAIVPPPSVTRVEPAGVCTAQGDRTLTAEGAGFIEVDGALPTVQIVDASGAVIATVPVVALDGCVAPGAGGVQICTRARFTLTPGTLPPGSYTLRLTNPPPADCVSALSPPFVVSPPPDLQRVMPARVCAGGGTITLEGTGFQSGAMVLVANTPAAATMVSGPNLASATFSAVPGMAGEMLDVTLRNPDGCGDTLPAAVRLLSGPIIFNVDPPFVYAGMTTPLTIFTTGIVAPLPASGAVVLQPGNIDLTAASRIDTAHPKRVIVSVPPTLASGSYDLHLRDAEDCGAVYPQAVTVVGQKTDLKGMLPPFGHTDAETPVTIEALAAFFQPGARAYLAPRASNTIVATPLLAVVFQSPVTLTAVVPKSVLVGAYDLVVVNPNGTIGFKDNAFRSEATAPPTISSVSPVGVESNVTTTVIISGTNFATQAGSTPPPVVLDCVLAGTTTRMSYTPTYNPGASNGTQVSFTIASGSIPAGNVCVPTVNNSGANTMFVSGGTVAVLQPSFNISTVTAGPNLTTPRRAPATMVNGPTDAARYLYVIGGDSGALSGDLPTSPLATGELALQDRSAGTGAFRQLPSQSEIPGGLTLSRGVSMGRFVYLVGGFATASLATVRRAKVLSPDEAPELVDADLEPVANGLAAGLYFYRVAAVLPASDAENPDGETLSGDEFAVRVPQFMGKPFKVTVAWTGGPPTAARYRVYRTALPNQAPGSEDVFFETTGNSFVDTGATGTAGQPLPFGALSRWAAMPALNVPRAGAAVALVPDPAGNGRAYVYAAYGFDSTAAMPANRFPNTYEFLAISLTTGAAIGGWSAPAATGSPARWLAGAYAVTPDVDPAACPLAGPCQAYVFIASGAGTIAAESAPAGSVGLTDVARVTPGSGVLVFGTPQADAKAYGYGAATAANYLFTIGGASTGGVTNKLDAVVINRAADSSSFPTTGASWGPQGAGVLPMPRFLPGAAFGPPFFHTVGGSALVGGAATDTTSFNLF